MCYAWNIPKVITYGHRKEVKIVNLQGSALPRQWNMLFTVAASLLPKI